MSIKSDTLLGGFLMPHPPIIISGVGHGQEKGATATIDALEKLTLQMKELQPETIVLISPHAPVFSDFVFFYEPISPSNKLYGDLSQFGDSQKVEFLFDSELQKQIINSLQNKGISAGILSEDVLRRYHISGKLDHGALVPLHFLRENTSSYKLIVLASPNFEQEQLILLGKVIREASETIKRKILIIASGDLSHKVNDASPYGRVDAGAQFDFQLGQHIKNNDLVGILNIAKDLREQAAECGYHSLVILCGALEGLSIESKMLSYEAPFGIGYGVASFIQTKNNRNTELKKEKDEKKELNYQKDNQLNIDMKLNHDSQLLKNNQLNTENQSPSLPEKQMIDNNSKTSENKLFEKGSAQVKLARKTIENYIKDHHKISSYEIDLPSDLLTNKAGVFVSLHKHGNLRGCIGTIAPTTESIADEIIQNAISASTSDPRFDSVTTDELPDLEVHVDILNPSEFITDKALLDPKRYGVIVESGMRRGLLLPDLEGVDSVEQQLQIACMKAGISPDAQYRISRFTVTRYEI